MSKKACIPIMGITVFGVTALLIISVGIVGFIGVGQATHSTRALWAEQSRTLINAMEESIDTQLSPLRDQALWVAQNISTLDDRESLDEFIFGTLAATPQVLGVALFTPDGKSRQWQRDERQAQNFDWSDRSQILDWIGQVETSGTPTWREPIWLGGELGISTLLHDIPLYDADERFIGVFSQIVPITDFSLLLSRNYASTGVTPFVLYDEDYVLAHPFLINNLIRNETGYKALLDIEELGDVILTGLAMPTSEEPFIADATDLDTKVVKWGDDHFIYIYRTVTRYGDKPWTIGAYINSSLLPNDETDRLIRTSLVALSVLVVAVIAAIVIGRRVSIPIVAIANAAGRVESGELSGAEKLPSSSIREINTANTSFNKMVDGLAERDMMRNTLGRFVPEEVANSLLAGGGNIEPLVTDATILFCDIADFTRMTESLGPVRTVNVLNHYFSSMVEILERHGGVVTQFQGDAILATFNVPVTNAQHAANAIVAAHAMLHAVDTSRFADQVIRIRIGINSGPVVAGAIGAEGRLNYTVHGDAVNLAARLESLNKEYDTRLLVAGSTLALAGEENYVRVGDVAVRGQTQSITVFTPPQTGFAHGEHADTRSSA
ncbi:MAG: adenylate/guanylate cyclase domain-containing protein [Pseudomonadota bacterium]